MLAMALMGMGKSTTSNKPISIQVLLHHLRLQRSEPPFPNIAGSRIHGGLSVMSSGMSSQSLHWWLQQLISIPGSSGYSIGLLRAQCSGLFLFLDTIGKLKLNSLIISFHFISTIHYASLLSHFYYVFGQIHLVLIYLYMCCMYGD